MRVRYGPSWDSPEATPLEDIKAFVREEGGARYADRRVPFGIMSVDVVESETHPGTYYELHLMGDGTWRCNCPGYAFRGECKHVKRKAEEC